MKKVFRINLLIATAILLLFACKKDPPSNDTGPSYIHWPVVKTLKATNIDSITAKLNGTVNGYGLSTTVIFEYGTTISYGSTVEASESPVTKDGVTKVSADISGLTCGKTYHFRIKAENSKWINFYGTDSTLTSGHIPTLKTTSISGIVETAAVSGGNILYDGCTVILSRGVCWSTTASPTTSDSKTSDGGGSGQYMSNIIGLTDGTTYHIRAYATNSAGTAYGNEVSFTTLSLPTVSNFGVTNLTSSTATVFGTVNANSSPSVITIEYGKTTSYGQELTPGQSPVTGNVNTDIAVTLTDLTCGTIYHLRAKAENSAGISYSEDVTFIFATFPALVTNPVTGITASSAVSGGNIVDDGCPADTSRGIQWSRSKSFLPCRPSPECYHVYYTDDGAGAGSFTSTMMLGLQPSTTYYVRAYAKNSAGTAYGNVISFSTLPGPLCNEVPIVETMAATNVSATGATLNGTVNANGPQTPVTFVLGHYVHFLPDPVWILNLPALPSPITGNSVINVRADVSGLNAGRYIFYVAATNTCGTTDGDFMYFTVH
jgi:hypothetical protein